MCVCSHSQFKTPNTWIRKVPRKKNFKLENPPKILQGFSDFSMLQLIPVFLNNSSLMKYVTSLHFSKTTFVIAKYRLTLPFQSLLLYLALKEEWTYVDTQLLIKSAAACLDKQTLQLNSVWIIFTNKLK